VRTTITILLSLIFLAGAGLPQGDKKSKEVKRFGILLDSEQFPQKTPKEALTSLTKAINTKQIDYLLAFLADPKFVDGKIDMLKKQFNPSAKEEARAFLAFERLVKLTTEHFIEDPGKVKDLQRFAKEGEWQSDEKLAIGTLKKLPTRKVFMRKIEGRWVLEDREK